jgi:hypothetical protein
LNDEEKLDLVAFLWALNGRMENWLDGAPDASDQFSARPPSRRERTPEASGPVLDPAYQRKSQPTPEGPVLDPAYQKPVRR